jgi:hypothetical protein
MHEVIEQTEKVILQRQGGFLDGLELGAPRGPEPLSKELGDTPRRGLQPELVESFLLILGARSLEVTLAQLGEAQSPLTFRLGALDPAKLGRSSGLPASCRRVAEPETSPPINRFLWHQLKSANNPKRA